MLTLHNFKQEKIYIEIENLANLITEFGLSDTVPQDEDGRISISYGIAMSCGMRKLPSADDFESLLEEIPPLNVKKFIMCWEALEMEAGEDIVVWSEKLGEQATVASLESLANVIRFV